MTELLLPLPFSVDRAGLTGGPLPGAAPTFRPAGEVITPAGHLLGEREVRHARARANQSALERLTR